MSTEEPAETKAKVEELQRGAGFRRWAASASVVAFLFFLVKGLLWLIVPVVVLAAR